MTAHSGRRGCSRAVTDANRGERLRTCKSNTCPEDEYKDSRCEKPVTLGHRGLLSVRLRKVQLRPAVVSGGRKRTFRTLAPSDTASDGLTPPSSSSSARVRSPKKGVIREFQGRLTRFAASSLVQSLGEQRQRDHHSDGEECNPCCLRQSPKRVSDDGHKKARIRVRLSHRAGGEQNRLSTSGEKRVWIALGQKLTYALGHLRTDQGELGMHLPRLDVTVLLRRGLVQRPGPGTRGA